MGNGKVKTPVSAPKWRPSVEKFKDDMIRKLLKNDHKGGWEEDALPSLLTRLEEEVSELRRAIESFENLPIDVREDPGIKESFRNFIRGETADVGNFAMMISDNTKNL